MQQQNVETPSADAGIPLGVEKKPMLSDEAFSEIEDQLRKNQTHVQQLQEAYAAHPSPLQPDKVDIIQDSLNKKSDILDKFPFGDLFDLQERLQDLGEQTEDPRLVAATEQTTKLLDIASATLQDLESKEGIVEAYKREHTERKEEQRSAEDEFLEW